MSNLNEEDLGSAYKTYVGGVQKEVDANKQAITDAYNALEIQAQDKLNADKIAAQNAYERSLSTYGAQAEALRSRGFNTGQQGGYSTFLDASANMTRQKAITDLDKAYQSLIADLGVKKSKELRTEDAKVTTAEATYNNNKLNAYAGILSNAGTGAYQSQGGVDNAISAYESLYGKMGDDQRTSIQEAYKNALLDTNPAGTLLRPTDYAALDDTSKETFKNNYLHEFRNSIGNSITSYLNAGDGDNSSITNDILQEFTDLISIDEDLANKAAQELKGTLETNVSKDNAAKLMTIASEIDKKFGNEDLSKALIAQLKNSLTSGSDFSYLGAAKDYDATESGKEKTTLRLADGDEYKIKVDNSEKVDEATKRVLEGLMKAYTTTTTEDGSEKSIYDEANDALTGFDEDSEAGYAVVYNDKMYFYSKTLGWLEVNNRTDSELDYLRGKTSGANNKLW